MFDWLVGFLHIQENTTFSLKKTKKRHFLVDVENVADSTNDSIFSIHGAVKGGA